MKKILLITILCIILLVAITGCGSKQKAYIGTYLKNIGNDSDDFSYIVLYEGGIGGAYNNREEFEATGYIPQPLTWSINNNTINITYKLVDRIKGYKFDKKEKTLTSTDGNTVYLKSE